jgi:hypothetical protein
MWRPRPSSERALGAVLMSALLASLLSSPKAFAASSSLPHVVYTSPVSGARYVRAGTGLIARFDRSLAGVAARDLPAFAVSGSASGTHAGRALVADGGKALLFRPDCPFRDGERVDVQLSGGVLGARATQFAFETAAVPARPLDARLRESLRAAENAGQPTVVLDSIPPSYPAVSTVVYEPPASGSLFMSNFSTGGRGAPFLLILDNEGQPVFYRQMLAMCTDFKLQPNGRLTYFDTGKGQYYALDESYAIVDSFACGNNYDTDEHELRLLPNGHALMIGDDPETVDMSQLVPFGDPTALVIGNIIQELDENKNVVFEWRSWDHFQITDATHENLAGSVIDYEHANAIDVDTDGNLLLSSRHMDEVTKIDHVTGATLWRWGGLNNQFTMNDPEGPFSHQHAIRRIANGDVTLFDNGDYRNPQYSRASEYQLDEVNKVATLVWEFRNTPDSYGNAMGYVQRLPDGHTLIGFGTGNPDAIEVAADGSKVMEVSLPVGQSSYRTLRQEWHPELAGVGPGPIGPRAAVSLSTNAPNPFRGRTELALNLAAAAHVTLQVFDLSGRKVLDVLNGEPRGPGLTRVTLDLAGRPAGMYFARVATEAGTASRRIVHVE